jgi:uncharacterized protein with HEPN domain
VRRPPADRLLDIQEAIGRCQAFRNQLEEANEIAYEGIFRGILYDLCLIGEAVNTLPSELTDLAPDIPWRAIVNLRNIVIHNYYRVERDRIDLILDTQLASLEKAIVLLLGSLD